MRMTLNRPSQRNAMNQAMVAALQEALAAAQEDAAVRVVVLRGAGGNFCAGADIADMAGARAWDGEGRDPIAVLNERFGRLCLAFAESAKPVVAVLEGAVIGGGFGLACVADIAIAAEDTKFRLSEATLGLVPAQIAPFLVARLGYATANRLAMTAAVLDGAAAEKLGLVHELAADEATLLEKLVAVIAGLKKSAPGALAAAKALLRRSRWEAPENLIAHAADVFAQSARGAEGIEGMTAFLQKRPPAWAV